MQSFRFLPPRALIAVFAAVLGLWLGGCTDDPKLANLCQSDSECPAGFACDSGRCVCRNDAACAFNEFCNPSGSCQKRIGCETSLDCEKGQYCDRKTGQCLDRERCTEDVQCALGEICDDVRFSCEPGCRDVGDCPLGAVCECPGGTSCQVGQCRTGPCGDDSFCRYGEKCVAETPGADKRCVRDERGPFCDACTIGPATEACPSPTGEANFCLIDATKGYSANFCGVECGSAGQECPWGFECRDVLILTESTCGGSNGALCPLRGDRACESDADCKGGVCDPSEKKCRSVCVGGEGRVRGYCSCLQDSDCPADTCDPTTFRCAISLQQCNPADPNPCPTIYCKHRTDQQTGTTIGYCHIGQNCAPSEGISCDMVRSQRQ